jgi:hypothetical protein
MTMSNSVGALPYVQPVTLFHPWRMLREMAHVTLRWHDGGHLGWCRHSTQEVSIQNRLTQAERRSTICHEILHLQRGPGICGYSDDEEKLIDRDAARLLIDIHDLGKAMQWSSNYDEMAIDLWVDRATVQTRMDNLHPAELHYLNRIVTAREGL